jgi:dethiobiotin synthetase
LKRIFPRGIFITGTDTDVGKTVATAALACCIEKSGNDVKVIKPFQTGTGEDGFLDIEFIYKALGRNFDLEEVCPVRLSNPLSPYSAAIIEKKELNILSILSSLKEKLLNSRGTILFEGAGGLLVPITKNYYMSDFAKDMGLPLIIVSRPGLGTLNHTLLTIEHAKRKGLQILGIIINNYPSNPDLAESLNIKTIMQLTEVEIIGVIPSIEGVDVQKGLTENLADNSQEFFINLLGGNLNLNNLLT